MTKLDFQKDFNDVYAYIVRRVTTFDPLTNKGPGDSGPITQIDAGFGFEQSGWVALVFDRRSDAEPDGEWNNCIGTGIHWRCLIGWLPARSMRRKRSSVFCQTLWNESCRPEVATRWQMLGG